MTGTARATEQEPQGDEREGSFGAFLAAHQRPLQRAFVSRYGVEVGNEVTAEAFALAWERWDEVRAMDNPRGYLYRVGQSRSRRLLRWGREAVPFPGASAAVELPADRLDLLEALGRLREDERVAVLLAHSYGWTYAEVATLLQVPVTTVNNHIHRGLTKLRSILEDDR